MLQVSTEGRHFSRPLLHCNGTGGILRENSRPQAETGDLFTSVGNSIFLGFLCKHLGPQSHLLHKLQEKRSLRTFTEELYKKHLHDPDNHDGVITHLEPDILGWDVKCALGSITTNKASGGDGIPVELLHILKDDAVKVLHSICQQIRKTQQWPQDWKRSVFIPIPKKGNAKECSNYCRIALNSHASKVMLKILQAILQQYVNHELPDVQAGFRKGRGIRNQIANIRWIIDKAREFQKSIYFCFIECQSL